MVDLSKTIDELRGRLTTDTTLTPELIGAIVSLLQGIVDRLAAIERAAKNDQQPEEPERGIIPSDWRKPWTAD